MVFIDYTIFNLVKKSDIANSNEVASFTLQWDNTINPDTKVTFEFEAKYSDNTLKNINDKTKIELAAGNPNLIKEIEKNSITFNAPLTREESLTLMATYFDDDFISENKSIFFVVNVIKD